MNPEHMQILLATVVKQFGKYNALALNDQQVHMPAQLRLHSNAEGVILVLLEGQEQIDRWEQAGQDPDQEDPNGIQERE